MQKLPLYKETSIQQDLLRKYPALFHQIHYPPICCVSFFPLLTSAMLMQRCISDIFACRFSYLCSWSGWASLDAVDFESNQNNTWEEKQTKGRHTIVKTHCRSKKEMLLMAMKYADSQSINVLFKDLQYATELTRDSLYD